MMVSEIDCVRVHVCSRVLDSDGYDGSRCVLPIDLNFLTQTSLQIIDLGFQQTHFTGTHGK